MSGADLANALLDAWTKLDVDINNCRGQEYDGAGTMTDHTNGVSAHILGLNKKALYRLL